jgi:putative FmdB family regulatory protein
MPIYEYKCNECGEVQEVLHKNVQNIETVNCIKCGSEDLTRLISTANVSVGRISSKGLTCCGREERCSTPPCSGDSVCRRD